jgi:hypothetical protein
MNVPQTGFFQVMIVLAVFSVFFVAMLQRRGVRVRKSSTYRITKTREQIDAQPHIALARESEKILAAEAKQETSSMFYSELRGDRSGSVLTDMLYAHAYAYHHNMRYGGACPGKFEPKKDTEELIEAMGWTDVFHIACPINNSVPVFKDDVYRRTHEYITPEWREQIQAMSPAIIATENEDGPFQIAVHVRRGDITPCHQLLRYLPNSHYMTLIERYLPEDGRPAEVTIYSESDHLDKNRGFPAVENFDVFREAGYIVKLDTDLPELWKALTTADVLIMSRSYFSFVPAIVNPNTIVMTEWFGFDPIPGWEQADAELVKKSDDERKWLGRNGCVKEEVSANKTDVGQHVEESE